MKHPFESRELDRGLDLFNRSHFFDAHEALEDVWREAPRAGPLRRHLQGLVQLAVAFHHESKANLIGARSVLDRALRNLNGAEESFPSLDLARLRRDLSDWQRHLAIAGADRDESPGQSGEKSLPNRPKAPRISELPPDRKRV